MLNGSVYYHGTMRAAIIAFGQLFASIYIDRRQGNSVSGAVVQRLQVPISYAPREKWLTRLDQNPSLDAQVYTSLPLISFEITSINYDGSRKLGKMQKIICNKTTSSTSIFSPVPYNIDISLYVLTKTQEDNLQIIEQILPTFTPEYTVSINAVPSLNIIQDLPITLVGVSMQDDYEGDFNQRRFVTSTLNFSLKLNIFGPVLQNKQILTSIAEVSTDPLGLVNTATYTATGDPTTFNINESWFYDL